MELTCACILFIVGFVTANPYGYGTKGGASAKADASAVAGAVSGVGDIPVSVPSGAGYSGSFSKSSASSFASSSASSSASSFSYGGSGALAYPGGNSGSGCGSGSCQGAGKGYNPATAGSYNNNVGSTGTGSTGYGNNYNANNLNGESYGSTPSEKSSECTSGSCQPGKVVPLGIGSNSYSQANSVAGTTGSGYGAPYPKISSSPDSGCKNGNCDLAGTNNKCISGQCDDNAYKNDSGNKKCTSGYCDNIPHTGSVSPYYANDNKCASGKCESNNEKLFNDNGSDDISVSKPDYGSKIHFSDSDNYGSSCVNGNCGSSNSKPSYAPAAPTSEPSKCSSPACNNFGSNPSSYSGATAAAGYNKPSTHLTAPKEDLGCTTPNCQSGPVNTKPSYNGYSPNYNAPNPVTSPGSNSPAYNGYSPSYSAPTPATSPETNSPYNGFAPNYNTPLHAMPPGAYSPSCTGGTCYSQTKAPYPTSTNYGSQPSPTIGNGCTSPNCGSVNPTFNCAGGNCGPVSGPHDNKGYNNQPNPPHYSQGGTLNNSPTGPGLGCSPNSPNCSPVAGSSGYYSPELISSPPNSAPGYGPSSYNMPTLKPPTSPFGQPSLGTSYGSPHKDTAGSHNGGSLNFPSPASNSYSAAGTSGPSNGYYKPGNAGQGSYQSAPGYTAPGIAPSSGYSSSLNTGSYTAPGYGGYTAPASHTPQNCNTPGCSNSAINNVASAQTGTGNLPTPSDGETHKNKPAYTGGFGGPAGVLKPNEFDVSSPTPKPSTPTAAPVKPNCISGDCGNPSAGTSPSYSHGGATAGASASANAVSYTGGFGGPPGFLTPYDDGKIDLPTGKQISHNGIKKGDSNANAGNNSGAQAHSAAHASAVAGASSGYKTGGCGGGCSGNHGGGANLGQSGSYGLSKPGYEGTNGAINIANASAKSLASADGNNSRGYAGSSATAHASAGVKSSYGKR